MTGQRRTVIVGAGIIGVSLALELARRGTYDVLVLETEDDVARGVTSLGSGGYRVQFTYPEEVALTVATIAAWREVQTHHDLDLGFHRNGYATLGSTGRAVETMRSSLAVQRAAGADVDLVEGEELSTLLPGWRLDDIPVAAVSRGDGWGHPPTVARELRDLAERAGARFRFGTTVTDVLQSGGRVTGVRVESGAEVLDLAADVVVNAAGLGSPALADAAGVPLRLGLWRQHQFLTAPVPGVHDLSFPCTLDPAHDLYLRPDGARVLVGYTEAWDADRLDYVPNPTIGEHARERLAHRWPLAAAEPFERAWVGCYELTPDRRAYIGLEPTLEGYAYSTGYSGHGLMNSLGAARALAEALDGEQPFVALEAFSRNRFDATGVDTDLKARDDASW